MYHGLHQVHVNIVNVGTPLALFYRTPIYHTHYFKVTNLPESTEARYMLRIRTHDNLSTGFCL